jgi:hypothetical protein
MNPRSSAMPHQPVALDPRLQPLGFLMRRYGRTPSPAIAGEIAQCLDGLLSNPGFRVPREERCTYRRMRTYWRLLASQG